MPVRLRVHLLAVGTCRHSERVTLRGGRWRAVEFPSICALLVHPTRGALLYDTGYAAHFDAATARFPERLYRWVTPVSLPPQARLQAQLERLGFALDDVGCCLISHFHADHVAGLRDLPRARFIAMRADREALRAATRLRGLRRGMLPALLPPDFDARFACAEESPRADLGAAWRGLGPAFDLFGDGSALAVALPGHTPAQMGLVLRDVDDREVFLCADACWSARAYRELRPPAWVTRALIHDWRSYVATLRRLHELAAARPELVLLPSHCAASLAAYGGGSVA